MSEMNSVGETTITTPSDREVVMARTFDAPRTLVWDAYTRPEHLRQWLLGPEGWTMPVCEVERLVNTESWGGDWPETENTVQLSEENGSTTVTTTILYPSKEARDAAMATGMEDGAERSYGLLDAHLKTMG